MLRRVFLAFEATIRMARCRWFEEDSGSEVVFWFDLDHAHDHEVVFQFYFVHACLVMLHITWEHRLWPSVLRDVGFLQNQFLAQNDLLRNWKETKAYL